MSDTNVKTKQPEGVELTDIDINSIPKQTGVCAAVFPLDLPYATLTQVEIADDKFMSWKKYKAFTVCFPFFVRKVGDVEANTKGVLDAMDAVDDVTACCTAGSMCFDYIAQQIIWGHAKPPSSYLLETFHEKGGDVAKTYIFKDKRSASERMCKMKIGHWSLYELGKDDDLLMKANYRRSCLVRSHYQMKDKEDKVLAAHQLRKPMCSCDCSFAGCKRMCCCPCYYMANFCSSYAPIATYFTPFEPTTEPPAYVPDYKVKEGFRLMGYSCIGLCCGKSHEAVQFPTLFGAGKELPAEAEEPEGDGDTKKKKLGDNRIIVKDKNPCAKMCQLFSPSFEDLPLEGLGEIGEIAAIAQEVAGEASELREDMEEAGNEGEEEVDKKAGQGGVKWARSKQDTYGLEYPRHFTSAQRLGMVLSALELDVATQM